MSASGIFRDAKNTLYNKALKASFKLRKDLSGLNPSIHTQLHLFDHTVKPIVLYGSEIWGTLNLSDKQKKLDLNDIFKDWDCVKLNIKFCKFVLGVNKRTTNIGVVAELERFSLFIVPRLRKKRSGGYGNARRPPVRPSVCIYCKRCQICIC